MIVSNKLKFAYARTHGCGDAAFEILLREKTLDEGDFATAMPYYNLAQFGENVANLKPFSTPKEIKKALGGDYVVIAIKRNPRDGLKAEYLTKNANGVVKETFEQFLSAGNFKFPKFSFYNDVDVVISFDDLAKDVRAFLKDYGVTLPTRFKFDEFDGMGISQKDVDALDYASETLEAIIAAFFPEYDEEEKSKKAAAEEEAKAKKQSGKQAKEPEHQEPAATDAQAEQPAPEAEVSENVSTESVNETPMSDSDNSENHDDVSINDEDYTYKNWN